MQFTKFDFLTLWVKEEARQSNIDWYVRHLGLTVGWDSPEEKLTLLQFPNKQALTLLAHYPDGASLPEGEVTMCLATSRLQEMNQDLKQSGERTSEIYKAPWSAEAFDFYDPQGTKLTASSVPAMSKEQPEHKFQSYFLHISVASLSLAEQWYSKYIGMLPVEHIIPEGCLLMRMPGDEQVHVPIYLSENGGRASGPVLTAVRPFFQVAGKPELESTHAMYEADGIQVSGITGNADDFMRWFDFWDPDGNPLYAIAY